MNLRALCWLAVSMAVGVGGMFLWDRFSPPQVVWSSDWAGAQVRAREDGRPVLAFFPDAAGVQDGILLERAVLDALNFRVIPLRLDPGNDPALAERLGVEGLPAWRLLDAGGLELSRRDGILASDQLLAWLKEPIAVPEGFTPP